MEIEIILQQESGFETYHTNMILVSGSNKNQLIFEVETGIYTIEDNILYHNGNKRGTAIIYSIEVVK